MKKVLAVLVAVGLVVSFACGAFAAEKKAAEKSMDIKGVVLSTDAAANTLTVKNEKTDVVVGVTGKTVITSGKETKSLADIKAGENVDVKYTKTDGRILATHISILTVKK